MEISIEKSLLQDVFSRVANVVEQKSISPMAGTVKMHIADNGLIFTAKGNEVYVQAIIDEKDFTVESDDICEVCIPSELFVKLLTKLPQYLNGIIKLVITPRSQGDYILAVTPPDSMKKDAKYQLDVLESNSFFDLPDINQKNSINIESNQLLEAINKVPFASASEQYYVVLLGVKFYTEGENLVVAATDGHRLAELILDCNETSEEPVDFLCYANGIEDLKSVFDFDEDSPIVNIAYGDSHVRFKQDEKVVYIRLIDGNFPDYKNENSGNNIIKKEYISQLEVDSSELLEYIKPAAVLTNVRLIMSFSPDGVTIKSESDKSSSVDIVEDIKWIDGPTINRVMFSAEYLSEQLAKFEGSRVTLKLLGEDEPIVICNDEYLHFLSCIKVKSDVDNEDEE
jgi:DNA polymerase III subunit beta